MGHVHFLLDEMGLDEMGLDRNGMTPLRLHLIFNSVQCRVYSLWVIFYKGVPTDSTTVAVIWQPHEACYISSYNVDLSLWVISYIGIPTDSIIMVIVKGKRSSTGHIWHHPLYLH